ncbi:hypothetical protein D0C36_00805 [Mucilaginibacter conchicola]|uniref:Uncharacterized protein n=2 Tax=Mucilaginibacter conchicola TaxID=2303333 RepID=A0A372NWR0_9SPHI|nr:hypothetical protein D0C36_00805 [Mucilaginibacter conchicola]
MTYAEHKGIKLMELWEAGEKDEHFNKTVEIGMLNLHLKAFVSRGVATSIDIGGKIITIADE